MYTIKQRLEIYEKMLKDFSLVNATELKFARADAGFCLWDSYHFTCDYYGLYDHFADRLPELWETCPTNIHDEINDKHWFSLRLHTNAQPERVTCLKRAIEICKSRML